VEISSQHIKEQHAESTILLTKLQIYRGDGGPAFVSPAGGLRRIAICD